MPEAETQGRSGDQLSAASLLVQGRDVISTMVDGRQVLLDRAGRLFELNEVAAQIWNLVATPTALEQVLERLTGDFDVDTVTARRDVLPFVRDLLRRELVAIS